MSPARYVNVGGVAVELGGGGGSDLSDQWPAPRTSDGVAAASSARTAIAATGSATPHTPGSYVEIDPSLSGDVAGVDIYFSVGSSASGTDTSTLLEIGVGAAAAEIVWATVPCGYLPTGA